MRARNKRRPIIEERAEVFGCEQGGRSGSGSIGSIGGRLPPFDSVVLQFSETEPGGDVGFVVEGGEDEG